MNVFESSLFGPVLHDLPNADAFDWSSGSREEQLSSISFIRGTLGSDEQRSALFEVLILRVDRGSSHRDEALFVAFAEHAHDADAFEDVREVDVSDFAGAQSRGVHEFKDRSITEIKRRLVGWSFWGQRSREEFFHLVGGEHSWKFLPLRGLVEMISGILRDRVVGVEPAEEDFDGRDVARDCCPGVASIFGERADVCDEVLWECVVRVVDPSILEIQQECFEVSGVRFDGRGEQAAFDADEVDEATAQDLIGFRELFYAAVLCGRHSVFIGCCGAGA